MSERDRKKMSAAAHAMGDNFHSMGDFLYRPVGTDADRPSGPRSKLPDQRLYQSPPKGNGSRANGKPSKPKTATKFSKTARAASPKQRKAR